MFLYNCDYIATGHYAKIIDGNNIKVRKDLTTKNEGFNYKNFYATHIIGPLFIRNPYLLDYFLEKICLKKKGV